MKQPEQPTSQNILFISDVHLGKFSEEKNALLQDELIKLIDYAEEHHFEVAILGDLFDYWMEYPGFVPSLGEKLLQRFKLFNEQNTNSLYITGNHDNWTLGHLKNCGFDVEPDYRILHINEQNILLLHGDAIGENVEHLKRPVFHRILRSSFFLKLYRGLWPPKAGLWFMQKFSKLSNFLEKNLNDTKKLNEWSKKMLHHSNIDYIICGHDHVPRKIVLPEGTYINLGAFYQHKSLAVYNNGTFKLVTWNSKHSTLTHFETNN